MTRNNLGYFKWLGTFSIAAIAAAATLPTAHAADSDGFTQLVQQFYGSERAKAAVKNCAADDDHDNDLGIMGGVNMLFCHLEKDMGITGTTAAAGVTKSFKNFVVHAIVNGSAGGASFGGYDFQAQVWACSKTASVTCTQASQFARAIVASWSFAADNSVNKGLLFEDSTPFGNAGGMQITWDVGSGTATKAITAEFANGSATFFAKSTKNSSSQYTFQLADITSSNTYEFAASIDPATGMVNASLYSNAGAPAGSVPTLSSSSCFTRSKSGADPRTQGASEFSYSVQSSGACSALPALAYPTRTPSSLSSDTGTSLGAANWGSMAATPSSI